MGKIDAMQGVLKGELDGYDVYPASIDTYGGANAVYIDIETKDGEVNLAVSHDKVFDLIRKLNAAHVDGLSRAARLSNMRREDGGRR